MRIRLQYRGQKNDIYVIERDNGNCPAIEFLDSLKATDPKSHTRLYVLIHRHADIGPILDDERKCRKITSRENLCEFKSPQGDRLPFFYLSGRRTVITHGFHKGDPEQNEFDKAEALRNTYQEDNHDR